MGRPRKKAKQAAALPELNKAARRRNARLAAAGAPTKKKRSSSHDARANDAVDPLRARATKALERAIERRDAGQSERAFAALLELALTLEAPLPELTSELSWMIEVARAHPLNKAQIKAITKSKSWRQIPDLRVALCHLLALAGRRSTAAQLVGPLEAEGASLAELSHIARLGLVSATAPRAAADAVLPAFLKGEGAGSQPPFRELRAALEPLRVSRLGLGEVARRALLLEVARRSLAQAFGPRLAGLLWCWREGVAQRGLLEATLEHEISCLSDLAPAETLSACSSLRALSANTRWSRPLELRATLAADVSGLTQQAIEGYLSLAKAEPRSAESLELLRRALELCDGSDDGKRGRELCVLVGRHSDAEPEERERARAPYRAPDRREEHLERLRRRVALKPEGLPARLALAKALLDRSQTHKSVANRLAAINILAETLALDPTNAATLSLIEDSVPLDGSEHSGSHAALKAALESAAESSPWASALAARALQTKSPERAREVLAAGLREATEETHLAALVRAAVAIDHAQAAREACVRARERLDHDASARIELGRICEQTRRDASYKGEDDAAFASCRTELGASALQQLARAYRDRRPVNSSAEAAALFLDAHEASPEDEAIALDTITSLADGSRDRDDFLARSEPLLDRHPHLARLAAHLDASIAATHAGDADARRASLLTVRREILDQHLRLYQEMERRERAKAESNEVSVAEGVATAPAQEDPTP
jgi:hypothetical protein